MSIVSLQLVYKTHTEYKSSCKMYLKIDNRIGSPMKPEEVRLPGEVIPTTDLSTINLGERLIRVVLMTGFVLVIAIEIWLLFKALQLWM